MPLQLAHTCASERTNFVPQAKPKRKLNSSTRIQSLFGWEPLSSRSPTPTFAEDEQGVALKAWLEGEGLPRQQLVTSQESSGGGRGLFASTHIPQGSQLLQIPSHLVITPHAAAEQLPHLAPLLAQHPLPAWSVLALWLADAKGAGAAHRWAPYLQIMPHTTGCVLEWSEEQVALLRGSHLLTVAEEIRGAARMSWLELQPLLQAAQQEGLLPPAACSPSTLRWAFCMLLTRLVRLQALQDAEALVPWADLLNHDCQADAYLDWNPVSSAVVLPADRGYSKGEQVVISYGQKTSGQLLLSYGFLPQPGSNPWDGCLLPLSVDAADTATRELKADALREAGLEPSQVFPLRMGALPQGLLPFAAMMAAEVSSRQEAQLLARQLFEGGGEGRGEPNREQGGLWGVLGGRRHGAAEGGLVDGSQELHRAALQVVAGACRRALSRYPTSLEVLKQQLLQLQQGQQEEGGKEELQYQSRGAGARAQGRREKRTAKGGGALQVKNRAVGGNNVGVGELLSSVGPERIREHVLQVLIVEQQVLNRTVFLVQQQVQRLKDR